MTFSEGENSKTLQKCSCNWFIAPISVAKMGTVAIGIRIGTCIGLGVGSVETVLHISIKAICIRVGLGVSLRIGVGQWKHTINHPAGTSVISAILESCSKFCLLHYNLSQWEFQISHFSTNNFIHNILS